MLHHYLKRTLGSQKRSGHRNLENLHFAGIGVQDTACAWLRTGELGRFDSITRLRFDGVIPPGTTPRKDENLLAVILGVRASWEINLDDSTNSEDFGSLRYFQHFTNAKLPPRIRRLHLTFATNPLHRHDFDAFDQELVHLFKMYKGLVSLKMKSLKLGNTWEGRVMRRLSHHGAEPGTSGKKVGVWGVEAEHPTRLQVGHIRVTGYGERLLLEGGYFGEDASDWTLSNRHIDAIKSSEYSRDEQLADVSDEGEKRMKHSIVELDAIDNKLRL
ncbi:hypothetical protein TWF696_005692 [Orbilia brochopaga]|uniref:Uncharacterized protein n=1 Tax=Orbilia brochopaga TaxID=3140254 RepID=A0AAV9UWU5_9PEZI